MTVVEWSHYADGRRRDGRDYDSAVTAARAGDGFVWVRLHQPDHQQLDTIAADFGLHPLAVEDALEAHQMPKVEHYGDMVFVVLKAVHHTPDGGPGARGRIAEAGELMTFVGSHFAVTVTHGDQPAPERARARVESDPGLLRLGPAAILYAVADATVDDYLDIAERFEADISELEESVFADARTNEAERIYRAKRQLLVLRRAVGPLAGPVRELSQHPLDHLPEVPETIRAYLRDVGDHLDRAHGLLAGHDEVVNSMLQANLAQLSVSQNNDMRTITSWAAIIAVPTAIAGIYGMNFTDMPELHWSLGYPTVLAAMAVVCVALYWNFKRRGWL